MLELFCTRFLWRLQWLVAEKEPVGTEFAAYGIV